MKRFLGLIAGCILLFAVPAQARDQNWTGGNALRPESVASYEWSGTGTVSDSKFLNVSGCGMVQVRYEDDVLGADTTATATLTQYKKANTASDSSDTTLSTDTTLTLTTGTYKYIRVHTVTNTGETTSQAGVTVQCQKQFTNPGIMAPGMEGDRLTDTTLAFLAGLTRVPFPDKLEPPDGSSWTRMYFSEGHTGNSLWPQGDDSKDCSTIEKACQTISRAREQCFDTPFTHCIFDPGDEWDVSSGLGTNGIGDLEDGDINGVGCPGNGTGVGAFQAAINNPCFWWTGNPGGSSLRAEIDATGSTISDKFMGWSVSDAERAGWLIEGFTLQCDADSGQGSACMDSFAGGILISVGNDMTVTDSNLTGSGQVVSSHDVSITQIYGVGDMDYCLGAGGCSAASSGVNTHAGTQDSSALVVHSSGMMKAIHESSSDTCEVVTATQGGSTGVTANGSADAELYAEAQNYPAYVLITNAHLQTCSGSTAANSVLSLQPEDVNGSESQTNWSRLDLVNAYLENLSNNAFPQGIEITPNSAQGSGYRAEIHQINTTYSQAQKGAIDNYINAGQIGSGDTVVWKEVNSIVEDTGGTRQHWRIGDEDVTNGNASVDIDIHDILHNAGTQKFWADVPSGESGFCIKTDVNDFETCLDAEAGGSGVWNATGTEVKTTVDLTSTADTSSATTDGVLSVAAASWTVDEWIGGVVRMTSGATANEVRRVTDSTATTITLDSALSADADGQGFTVEMYADTDGYCAANKTRSGECAGVLTTDSSLYDMTFDDRGICPPYLCGVVGRGYNGDPTVSGNLGRQRPDPWAPR